MSDRVPMDIVGIRIELPTNTPILLLKEAGGERYLPIWINTPEATSIALARDGMKPQRPLTHDLVVMVVEELDATVVEVVVTELRGGTFFADLVLSADGDIHRISSRPSDAVAVAVRADAPVYAHRDVLDEAGVVISDDEAESEIERFREFLEDIDPGDFGASTES